MKALLTVLLLGLCSQESLSTGPTLQPVKPILCYECSQSGTFKCDDTKVCNSTSGFCHLITYEGQNGETYIKESCATDCGFPSAIFTDTKNYFALCCSFQLCNTLQYSREVIESHTNIPVSGFTASLFWACFRIILQFNGLGD